jgi:hypothetical protein
MPTKEATAAALKPKPAESCGIITEGADRRAY